MDITSLPKKNNSNIVCPNNMDIPAMRSNTEAQNTFLRDSRKRVKMEERARREKTTTSTPHTMMAGRQSNLTFYGGRADSHQW